MVDIAKADEQQLAQMKAWFFKENVRILEARRELEEDRERFEQEKREVLSVLEREKMEEELSRGQLQREQELFEKKLVILQNELRRLAEDKKQLEREKALLKEKKERQQSQTDFSGCSTRIFFKGVNSELALKKRYRDLIKIFHPDNLNGDTESLQSINREYDYIKRIYSV